MSRDGKPGSLLIRGGRLIDPLAKVDALMDILLRDGQVVEISLPNKIRGGADEKFDARGLIVAPGFIDLHVHLREPGQSYKETVASGTAAAAAGGFTSVCCMPNTQPVLDSPEWVTWLRQPQRGAVVNVFPIAAATQASKGAVLTDFRALQRAGAVAVTDDGKPVLSDTTMRDALRASAEINFPIVQHAEDTRTTQGCSMNEGPTSLRLGLRGMSVMAEAAIVDRDVQLAQQFNGARLHVAHLSTAEALTPVRRAKRNRARVSCEVTPHHFALTDADIHDYDTNFKMNPPLRSAQDREAIIEGLVDGTLAILGSDHAPHCGYEKEVEFDYAPFGITGLETELALSLMQLYHTKRLALSDLIAKFTVAPARLLRLDKGTLSIGADGDVTVFDPDREWVFEKERMGSKAPNSPFLGWRHKGKAVVTIVGGKIVWGDDSADRVANSLSQYWHHPAIRSSN